MGINIFGSSSNYDTGSHDHEYQDPVPNPEVYNIIDRMEVNGFTILMINYPHCTNYEGNKIVVYESFSFLTCNAKHKLDPHFCEDRRYSPIARFEPTQRGWDWAIRFCEQVKR